MTAAALFELASARAWPKVQLGDVLEVQNGFAFSSKKFSEKGGVPLVRIRDLKDNGASAVGFLGDYEAAYVVNDGDLLIGMDGEFRCYEWRGGPALLNQRVCRLVNFDSQLHPRFLFYGINKHLKEIEDETSFTTVKHLSSKTIKAIEFPLPPLEAQKRIVAVLDQAFAALDRARALAEANLADAEELFDGWLTSVFHDHPAEWATRKLRDLCHQITVGHVGPMANRYSSTGTPFLRSQNVRPFRIDLADVKFIDDAFRSELNKSELRPGDVAIVRTGYPGTAAVIPDDLPLANCADLVIARPKEELHPEFLAMFLNSSFGKKMVAEKSVGAAQKHFNVGAAKEVDFAYPTLEKQRAIVSQMKAMRGYSSPLHNRCQAKIDELQGLRQSLLQKAFAGELT
ncbi:MAG: restriction endonuclease subunit S [Tsuneonella sp.]